MQAVSARERGKEAQGKPAGGIERGAGGRSNTFYFRR